MTTWKRVVLSSVACVVLQTLASRAGAEPVACQREIAKSTAKFVQAKMKALQKCNDAVVLGSASGPCPDGKATATITSASSKLRVAIAKKCGGADRACGTADDDSLASIGWDIGSCPNFESGSCTNAITDCDGVSTCLLCVGEAAVDQAITLYYGALDTNTTDHDVISCQRAIGKNTAKFFAAKNRALQKCEDGVLKGTLGGPCPDATKAAPAIAKAE